MARYVPMARIRPSGLNARAVAGGRGPAIKTSDAFASLGGFGGMTSAGSVRLTASTTGRTGPGGSAGGASDESAALPATPRGAPAAIQVLTSAILAAGSDSPPFGIRLPLSELSSLATSSLSAGLPGMTTGLPVAGF